MIVCRQAESDLPHWSSLHKPGPFNPHTRPLSPPPARMANYFESPAPRRHDAQRPQHSWHDQYPSYLPEGGAFSHQFSQRHHSDRPSGHVDGLQSVYQPTASPEAARKSSPAKDDDEELDDEDMDAEGEAGSQPMTAAERMAAKRKMKRFRLTHQQTRFLMSEFAKQPHPDASHRERLSREIPGLSSRQVQVWFQNRRAKIKRLSVNEREQVIKMRAVPDGFDNVQALHAPYGAVHNVGVTAPPMASTVDFCSPQQPYQTHHSQTSQHSQNNLIRTLPEMRRSQDDSRLEFNSPSSLGTPELLSPLSASSGPASSSSYGPHLSPSSAGPSPSSRTFGKHIDSVHRIRPLQPLQLSRRSHSETLHSPLRTAMSWKGASIDYSYSTTSPRPVYQPESSSSAAYESGSYSNSSEQPRMSSNLPSIDLYRTSAPTSASHAHSYSASSATSAPYVSSRQPSPPSASATPTTQGYTSWAGSLGGR